MNFLLDTHVLIWAAIDSSELTPSTRDLIAHTPNEGLAIADVSLLEIAILADKNLIKLHQPLGDLIAGLTQIYTILPINPAIAATAYELPLPQSDPFDRTIAATALYHKLPLITCDRHITASACVQTIW
jgi:PIN domain nuclease of toxin-antitoxin system